MAWIVAAVYWILLSSTLQTITDQSLKAINIIEHTTNLIVVLIDLFLSRSRLSWKDVIFPMIVALLYTFWTWIFVYSGVWEWPYPFFRQILNPLENTWWVVVVTLIGGTLVFAIAFCIVFGMYRLREYLALRKTRKEFEKRMSQNFGDSPMIFTMPPPQEQV